MSRLFCRLGYVEFPKPRGININMMPFVLGEMDSLPVEVRHYGDLVERCLMDDSRIGKVGYLSIRESYVIEGRAQNHARIHMERRDGFACGDGMLDENGIPRGGIFMASNVENSCGIWNGKNSGKPFYSVEKNELIWMTDRTWHASLPVSHSCYRQWFRVVIGPIGMWRTKYDTRNSLGILPDRESVVL